MIKKCKKCNRDFIVLPSRKKFCSNECYGHAKKPYVHKKCLECNKIFYIKPSHDRRKGRGQYCSLLCRSKSKLYLTKISKANINAWKLGKKKTYIRHSGYGRDWKQTEKAKNILRRKLSGENHPKWKGGISKTREYKKIYSGLNRLRRLKMGKLSLQTIQLVYEDNIKRYGTLTCYLCLKPIEFGQDSLDHKIPLVRGGSNNRDNLDIVHKLCNSIKHIKTPEEYKEYVSK